jgi:hypothetical protein
MIDMPNKQYFIILFPEKRDFTVSDTSFNMEINGWVLYETSLSSREYMSNTMS